MQQAVNIATAMTVAMTMPRNPNPPKAENGRATNTIPKSILRIEIVRFAMSITFEDEELFVRIIVVDGLANHLVFK